MIIGMADERPLASASEEQLQQTAKFSSSVYDQSLAGEALREQLIRAQEGRLRSMTPQVQRQIEIRGTSDIARQESEKFASKLTQQEAQRLEQEQSVIEQQQSQRESQQAQKFVQSIVPKQPSRLEGGYSSTANVSIAPPRNVPASFEPKLFTGYAAKPTYQQEPGQASLQVPASFERPGQLVIKPIEEKAQPFGLGLSEGVAKEAEKFLGTPEITTPFKTQKMQDVITEAALTPFGFGRVQRDVAKGAVVGAVTAPFFAVDLAKEAFTNPERAAMSVIAPVFQPQTYTPYGIGQLLGAKKVFGVSGSSAVKLGLTKPLKAGTIGYKAVGLAVEAREGLTAPLKRGTIAANAVTSAKAFKKQTITQVSRLFTEDAKPRIIYAPRDVGFKPGESLTPRRMAKFKDPTNLTQSLGFMEKTQKALKGLEEFTPEEAEGVTIRPIEPAKPSKPTPKLFSPPELLPKGEKITADVLAGDEIKPPRPTPLSNVPKYSSAIERASAKAARARAALGQPTSVTQSLGYLEKTQRMLRANENLRPQDAQGITIRPVDVAASQRKPYVLFSPPELLPKGERVMISLFSGDTLIKSNKPSSFGLPKYSSKAARAASKQARKSVRLGAPTDLSRSFGFMRKTQRGLIGLEEFTPKEAEGIIIRPADGRVVKQLKPFKPFDFGPRDVGFKPGDLPSSGSPRSGLAIQVTKPSPPVVRPRLTKYRAIGFQAVIGRAVERYRASRSTELTGGRAQLPKPPVALIRGREFESVDFVRPEMAQRMGTGQRLTQGLGLVQRFGQARRVAQAQGERQGLRFTAGTLTAQRQRLDVRQRLGVETRFKQTQDVTQRVRQTPAIVNAVKQTPVQLTRLRQTASQVGQRIRPPVVTPTRIRLPFGIPTSNKQMFETRQPRKKETGNKKKKRAPALGLTPLVDPFSAARAQFIYGKATVPKATKANVEQFRRVVTLQRGAGSFFKPVELRKGRS